MIHQWFHQFLLGPPTRYVKTPTKEPELGRWHRRLHKRSWSKCLHPWQANQLQLCLFRLLFVWYLWQNHGSSWFIMVHRSSIMDHQYHHHHHHHHKVTDISLGNGSMDDVLVYRVLEHRDSTLRQHPADKANVLQPEMRQFMEIHHSHWVTKIKMSLLYHSNMIWWAWIKKMHKLKILIYSIPFRNLDLFHIPYHP